MGNDADSTKVSPPAVGLRGATKRYGGLAAVDGVDLAVRPGELFGLLGPNGAGKTTTINLIAGYIAPDAGEVRLDGLPPTRPEARRRLGLAPQEIALYDGLTARENLAFFGSLYGLTRRELAQRVDWALDVAGLKDRAHEPVKRFSGGMARRLNLVCALVHRPEILLADEPTAGVDPQSRAHIFDTIRSLAAEGTTVVYTTHYMEEASALCERIAILDHGKLLALGTEEELLKLSGERTRLDFELTGGEILDDLDKRLRGLAGVIELAASDGRLTLFTDPAARVLASAVGLLNGAGLRVGGVDIVRADLETVFLSLTGRALRDGG
ncbi:MAG TPA: ABC transporter ATP-binding protein [bacterium]|nr:ABC transporter ATP-binding protein [bacterium]